MKLEEFYIAVGGSLEEVLGRIPSQAFVLRLLRKFVADPSRKALDEAVAARDAEAAFRAVHTLKGVTLSLGLTGLATTCIALTEKLRPGTFGAGWEEDYRALCAAHDETLAGIAGLEG